MKKVYLWCLGFIVIVIILLGFSSLFRKLIVRYAGEKMIAVVTEVPSRCDKYNHIKVYLDGVEHEIDISKGNCRKGAYRVEQRVELLKYKNYTELVWPSSHPELAIIAIIVVLLFVLFSFGKNLNK